MIPKRFFKKLARLFLPGTRLGKEAHWEHLIGVLTDLPRQRRFDEIDRKLRAAYEWLRDSAEDDPGLPTKLAQLADIFHDLAGNDSRAEELYREAIASAERSPRIDSIQLAIPLNSLSLLLLQQRRFEESERHLRRLQPIIRDLYGEQHSEYAVCLENLAAVLRQSGRQEESASLRNEAVRIRKETSASRA